MARAANIIDMEVFYYFHMSSGARRGSDSTSIGMLVIVIPSRSLSIVGGRSYLVGIRFNPTARPIC